MSQLNWAIETRALTKRYGKRNAVNHLNLKVPTGSVFAFLGRNGAGKTTTIRMLLNLLDRTDGEISVLGLDPRKHDFEIKQRIGYVSQDQSMYDWMTVNQIIWFCAGLYPTWDDRFTQKLITDLELPPNEKLRNLSKGTQAKVALLLAMAHHPELMILDEPTAGLDVVVRREFLEGVIDLIQQEGRTVFFSTHLVHEVERVADWVGVIDQGQMVACGELEELKRSVKRISMAFDQQPPSDIKLDGVLSYQTSGRQTSIIVRQYSEAIKQQLSQYQPTAIDVQDLSLEDIFLALVGEGA